MARAFFPISENGPWSKKLGQPCVRESTRNFEVGDIQWLAVCAFKLVDKKEGTLYVQTVRGKFSHLIRLWAEKRNTEGLRKRRQRTVALARCGFRLDEKRKGEVTVSPLSGLSTIENAHPTRPTTSFFLFVLSNPRSSQTASPFWSPRLLAHLFRWVLLIGHVKERNAQKIIQYFIYYYQNGTYSCWMV